MSRLERFPCFSFLLLLYNGLPIITPFLFSPDPSSKTGTLYPPLLSVSPFPPFPSVGQANRMVSPFFRLPFLFGPNEDSGFSCNIDFKNGRKTPFFSLQMVLSLPRSVLSPFLLRGVVNDAPRDRLRRNEAFSSLSFLSFARRSRHPPDLFFPAWTKKIPGFFLSRSLPLEVGRSYLSHTALTCPSFLPRQFSGTKIVIAFFCSSPLFFLIHSRW